MANNEQISSKMKVCIFNSVYRCILSVYFPWIFFIISVCTAPGFSIIHCQKSHVTGQNGGRTVVVCCMILVITPTIRTSWWKFWNALIFVHHIFWRMYPVSQCVWRLVEITCFLPPVTALSTFTAEGVMAVDRRPGVNIVTLNQEQI